MRQTEILLLLGVFVVGLFVVYWLKKHRHAGHNQALAAQLKRYPSVRKAWLAAGAKREAVLLVPGLKKLLPQLQRRQRRKQKRGCTSMRISVRQ